MSKSYKVLTYVVRLASSILPSTTFANIFLVAVSSVFMLEIPQSYFLFLHLALSIIFGSWLYTHSPKNWQFNRQAFLVFIVCFTVVCLRFPMIYPTYDDFVFHFMLGDYARTIWTSDSFMPLWAVSYSPPFYDMNYTYLLRTIGVRATIFVIETLLVISYAGLLAKIQSTLKIRYKKTILSFIFLVGYFYPHMMATHGTLMTDFASLVFTLEFLYLMRLNTVSASTTGLLFAVLSLSVKQSTGIFLVPIYAYYAWLRRGTMYFRLTLVLAVTLTAYFVRMYIETRNPFFGLFNGLFTSPLYPTYAVRNPLFGPNSYIETVAWPIIAQFTDRYGEGTVGLLQKYAFSWVATFGYLGSFLLMITRRSSKYAAIFCSYLLWSIVAGYSRYYTTLNVIALIVILDEFVETKLNKIKLFTGKSLVLMVVIIVCICYSTVKTDFSWRPYPSLRTPAANEYFWSTYTAGLKLLFKDTIPNLSEELSPVFSNYDAVATAFRGQSTMIAYLASFKGINVYNGVTQLSYVAIMEDPKISSRLKNNLNALDSKQKVLLLADSDSLETAKTLRLQQTHVCEYIGKAPTSRYLQRDYFYQNVSMFDCVKR